MTTSGQSGHYYRDYCHSTVYFMTKPQTVNWIYHSPECQYCRLEIWYYSAFWSILWNPLGPGWCRLGRRFCGIVKSGVLSSRGELLHRFLNLEPSMNFRNWRILLELMEFPWIGETGAREPHGSGTLVMYTLRAFYTYFRDIFIGTYS